MKNETFDYVQMKKRRTERGREQLEGHHPSDSSYTEVKAS